ncbi:hypothetical protein CALVIDRAFT_431146 [Calocera viscosa TUFC12733]|uniref:Uncharacterized protein n=1 Tax=Calocera viscosa (strain TUFC12733) TaxID=1330018 RepID=A0A167FZE8_CALVF|nr:hypothetical protein CALVIDRAFT_431146 [Calocera viscosa TUFC12733]
MRPVRKPGRRTGRKGRERRRRRVEGAGTPAPATEAVKRRGRERERRTRLRTGKGRAGGARRPCWRDLPAQRKKSSSPCRRSSLSPTTRSSARTLTRRCRHAWNRRQRDIKDDHLGPAERDDGWLPGCGQEVHADDHRRGHERPQASYQGAVRAHRMASSCPR